MKKNLPLLFYTLFASFAFVTGCASWTVSKPTQTDEHGCEIAKEEKAKKLFYESWSVDLELYPKFSLKKTNAFINRYKNETNPTIRDWVLNARSKKGYALAKLNRHEEALAAWDENMEFYRENPDPKYKTWFNSAIRSKHTLQANLGKIEEATALYDVYWEGFWEETVRDCMEFDSFWMANEHAGMWEKLGNWEEAIAFCDEYLERFDNLPQSIGYKKSNEGISDSNRMLANKIFAMINLGRRDEAIALVGKRMEVYKDREVFLQWHHFFKALSIKGSGLYEDKKQEQAIMLFDISDAIYDISPKPFGMDWICRNFYTKGLALEELGRSDEALAAYETCLTRFQNELGSYFKELFKSAEESRNRLKMKK